MSEIDLSKPLQYTEIGKEWIDVTWRREMPDGELVIEYGGDRWAAIRHPGDCARLRNKPERKVRPYTFEEAVGVVGKAVRCNGGAFLVTSARPNETIHVAGGLGLLSLALAAKSLTHLDGSPFGVVEDE